MDVDLIKECAVRMLLLESPKRIKFMYVWVLCISSVVVLHVQNVLKCTIDCIYLCITYVCMERWSWEGKEKQKLEDLTCNFMKLGRNNLWEDHFTSRKVKHLCWKCTLWYVSGWNTPELKPGLLTLMAKLLLTSLDYGHQLVCKTGFNLLQNPKMGVI